MSPLGALAHGLVAGAVGTAAMTAAQEAVSRVRGGGSSSGGDDGAPSWDEAPAPAVVARRILEGVFGLDVPPERIGVLTNAMHWGYGTAWGSVYGLVQGTARVHPLVHGLVFGAGVWGASYAQLVPMGLYAPPWEYGPKTLAPDLGYHAAYGLATAGAYAALDR